MPTYGYRCTQCGHEFEIFQSMSAAPLTACPECSAPLRKILYPVGVQFKGSGFYTTDYKNGGVKAGAKSDAGKDSSDKSDSPATTTDKPKESSGDKAAPASKPATAGQKLPIH
jgi:putative FmdB family regulatory protein